MFFVI